MNTVRNGGKIFVALAACTMTLSLMLTQSPVAQASTTIRIGARGIQFPEQQIAGYLYDQILSAHGFKVTLDESFSSAETDIFSPLEKGDLDVEPDYLGNGLVDLNKLFKPGTKPQKVWKTVNSAFEKKFKLQVLTPAYGFNDQNAFVTTKADSKKFRLKTFSDFAKVAPKLRVEVFQTCAGRVDCLTGFNKVYRPKGIGKCGASKPGCEFKSFSDPSNGTDQGTLSPFYGDLMGKKFDIVQGFGTDAAISHHHLVNLADNKNLLPPDALSPFIRKSVAKANPKLVKWLNKLDAVITTANFSHLNAEDVFGGKLPQNIAHAFLMKHHLL